MRLNLNSWYRRLFCITTLILLAACNLPGRPQPAAEDDDAIRTQVAETISAQLTQVSLPAVTATPGGVTPTSPPIQLPSPTLAATQTIAPSPSVQPTPPSEPTREARLVYEDDFSDDDGFWYTGENDNFGFKYVDDGYQIYINIRKAPIWSIREVDVEDVIVDVEAALVEGSSDGYYGVVCRHQGEDDYYSLVVSPDGSYGIAKMEDGEYEFLAEGQDQSGAIHGGDTPNRVRGECIGETLTLYANGHKLLEVEDDNLLSGDVGLLAGTRLSGGIEVLFTYFAILEP
jgi:hypothetical protein